MGKAGWDSPERSHTRACMHTPQFSNDAPSVIYYQIQAKWNPFLFPHGKDTVVNK